MKSQIGILLSLLVLSVSPDALADGIRLGDPSYGGTGCPGGSASVSLSPDQKAISILFDQYVVEAGGSKSFDRKNCNIAVPVHVPQGYSVAVMAIDYRGFVQLPRGARANLMVNYFLAGGGRGVTSNKSFYGESSQEYVTTDRLGLESIVWSACGASTILRANTSMLVQSNSRREQAMATVDSADIEAGLIYHIQWKSCR
ncbi:MAG TPA: DUF4360 domain-containing protein [Bdellovibrionota bacterium]|jgi:hypothetical protein